jgi:hypothetical protein
VRSCFRTGELVDGEVSILGNIECRVGRAGRVLERDGAAKYGFAGEPSRMGFIKP